MDTIILSPELTPPDRLVLENLARDIRDQRSASNGAPNGNGHGNGHANGVASNGAVKAKKRIVDSS